MNKKITSAPTSGDFVADKAINNLKRKINKTLDAAVEKVANSSNLIGDIKYSMLSEVQLNSISDGTWYLADGRGCSATAYARITGNTSVPDLRGAFLRGTGNSGIGLGTGPSLGTVQADATAVNGLANSGVGDHVHGTTFAPGSAGGSFTLTSVGFTATTSSNTGGAGAHNHTLSGDSETRPSNYGVNIFIKVN